eukprot:COSAG06_NODE_13048_length_1298_cov_8.623853_2_plen_163_part_00
MLEVSHTLMRQELHRLTKARLSSRKKKRSRAADSSDESSDESSIDESETPPKQTGKAAKKAQLADDAKGGGKGGGGQKRSRGKGKQFQGKKGLPAQEGQEGQEGQLGPDRRLSTCDGCATHRAARGGHSVPEGARSFGFGARGENEERERDSGESSKISRRT